MTLRRDIRFAFQGLAKHRRYAALAIVTIALATGAAIGIASIAWAALLRPLPFPRSDRLAMLYITAAEQGRAAYNQRWSFGRFQLLRRMQSSFADVATFGPQSLNLQGSDQSERITGERVSAAYFRTIGVVPLIGRTFAADEDSIPGARPVAVLGYDLWRRRFGGDSGVVGHAFRVQGHELTVIGIMPAGFQGLTGRAELWTTDAMAPLLSYRDYLTTNQNFISIVARLRPGVTFETARAEMDVLGRRIQATLPSDADEPTTFAATAVPLNHARVDPANREAVLILLAAAVLLLLIAAANLASLQLGRALDRRREIAVRLALGASRRALVQQLLTESTILALIGTLGGLAVSTVLSAWLVAPDRTVGVRGYYGQLAEFATTRLDVWVVAFALLLAIGLSFLFGLVPALRATRLDLTRDLRGRQASGGWSRLGLQRALVVTEVALALILSIGASLLVKSLIRIQRVDRGFDAANLLTFRIQPSDVQYPEAVAPALIEQVLARVSAVPGVVSASVDAAAPFEGPANTTLYIVGRPEPSPGRAPGVTRHYVGPDHFKTLGIPVLRGRPFTPNDRAGRPGVTIINRTAALRFWPGQDPIGREVWFGGGSAWNNRDSTATVVGVVGDVPYGPPDVTGPQPSFYTPYLQFTYSWRTVLVRTSRDQAGVIADLRKAVEAVVPDLPIFDVRTMDERLDATWSKPRFRATLLAAVSLLALLFAATGVYGVIGQLVSQRTYEMGVRMAIGGESRKILGLVVGTATRLAVFGVGIGLAGAFGLARLIGGLLYDTAAIDLPIFGAIAAMLVMVAAAASLIPAHRATRIDPLIVLRAD